MGTDCTCLGRIMALTDGFTVEEVNRLYPDCPMHGALVDNGQLMNPQPPRAKQEMDLLDGAWFWFPPAVRFPEPKIDWTAVTAQLIRRIRERQAREVIPIESWEGSAGFWSTEGADLKAIAEEILAEDDNRRNAE